jgi:hypothetical protein
MTGEWLAVELFRPSADFLEGTWAIAKPNTMNLISGMLQFKRAAPECPNPG